MKISYTLIALLSAVCLLLPSVTSAADDAVKAVPSDAAVVVSDDDNDVVEGKKVIDRDSDKHKRDGKKFSPYQGLIDSSDLTSGGIYNMQDEEIGSVDRLLVDSETGKVRYAVISVGGFLGAGARLVSVPWSVFQIRQKVESKDDLPKARIYLNADKKKLEAAPIFDAVRVHDLTNEEASKTVFDHWDAKWPEGSTSAMNDGKPHADGEVRENKASESTNLQEAVGSDAELSPVAP